MSDRDPSSGPVGRLLLSDAELTHVDASSDIVGRIRALFLHQQQRWELLRKGYEGLSGVAVRAFEMGGTSVEVHFNPGRLTSSTANVDDSSIRQRRCFLCPSNLPADQRGLPYGSSFLILCNPYPIFPEHLTVSHVNHVPQSIHASFDIFLGLTRALGSRFTVFYNGPRCGASAPDHLHFQAGTKTFMPIEREMQGVLRSSGKLIRASMGVRLTAAMDFSRPFVAIEGSESGALGRAFEEVSAAFRGEGEDDLEPMMNIIGMYDDRWTILVFPRRKHRPSFYFEEGEKKILLSPAAVDLGGVCILPREEDFRKIRREDLEQMYREVCFDRAALERAMSRIIP